MYEISFVDIFVVMSVVKTVFLSTLNMMNVHVCCPSFLEYKAVNLNAFSYAFCHRQVNCGIYMYPNSPQSI